jgi:hypothetical protein
MEPSLEALEEVAVTAYGAVESESMAPKRLRSAKAEEYMTPEASIASVTIEERATNIEFSIEIPYTIPLVVKNIRLIFKNL